MYDQIMKNDDVKISQSIQKFNRVMVEGLAINGVRTIVYSERPVNRKNCEKKYLAASEEEENNVYYHYSRIFNLPIIGIVYAILSSFCWLFIHMRKDDIVILDTYQLAIAIGTICASKLRRINCVGIVTDIPTKSTFYADGKKVSNKSKFNDWLITKCDGMIFITEQMNEVVNPKNKPYIVVEGFADLSRTIISNKFEEKYKKWTVMYTGGVYQSYGLDMLLQAFIEADLPDSQLIIYGGGPYVEEVKKYSDIYEKVVYGGVKNNNEIVCEQTRATLLVNPRYTNHEFTKYSFPGKNVEYMASGTPTLTTDLPGMPTEYKEHLFVLSEETVSGMKTELQSIYSISRLELHRIGLEAQKWMIDNKSNKVQAKKIIDFICQTYMR